MELTDSRSTMCHLQLNINLQLNCIYHVVNYLLHVRVSETIYGACPTHSPFKVITIPKSLTDHVLTAVKISHVFDTIVIHLKLLGGKNQLCRKKVVYCTRFPHHDVSCSQDTQNSKQTKIQLAYLVLPLSDVSHRES